MNIQYAIIPINLIKTKRKSSSISLKITRLFKTNNIVVKIGNENQPYIEEIITKNKIGLSKQDNYNLYIPGEVIYTLCTKEQAYLEISLEKNYYKKILNFFSKNG